MPKGKTSVDDGHSHDYEVDASGNGKTAPGPQDGHVHDVIEWKVQSANNHIHSIDREAAKQHKGMCEDQLRGLIDQ